MPTPPTNEAPVSNFDERLREVEKKQSALEALLPTISANVSLIRDDISDIKDNAIRPEQFNQLDSAVKAAHKRIDEFVAKYSRIVFEHDSCMLDRKTDSVFFDGLKLDIADLKRSVTQLTAKENDASNWWTARGTKLLDSFLPAVLVALAVLLLKG